MFFNIAHMKNTYPPPRSLRLIPTLPPGAPFSALRERNHRSESPAGL